MSEIASQISGVPIICLTVGPGADKKETSKLHVTGLR